MVGLRRFDEGAVEGVDGAAKGMAAFCRVRVVHLAAQGWMPIFLFNYYLFSSCSRNILLVCSTVCI